MSTDPERQLDKLIARHAGRPPDQHTRDALARARRDAVSRVGRRPVGRVHAPAAHSEQRGLLPPVVRGVRDALDTGV